MTDQKRAEDGIREVVDRLVCPVHGSPLHLPTNFVVGGVPWNDGTISCDEGCGYQIQNGIPRLVSGGNYADAFGLQWQRYQKTQLDSHTGQPVSRQRLERCLGMPVEELAGKKVLECGSGAGRFTEHLLGNPEVFVSTDFSNAVNANLRNLGGKSPYLLIQADINASPLPKEYFDVVICVGVVQHTPSPEQTIASLASHVAPGGLLVIDHYTQRTKLTWLGEVLTIHYPLRAVLKRVPPKLGLQATILLTAVCDPVRRHTCKIRWLDRIVARVLPSACHYPKYPELDPSIVYEWNELDTHDGLTDYYKHRRTATELQDYVQQLGLTVQNCHHGGNGIEIRAKRAS